MRSIIGWSFVINDKWDVGGLGKSKGEGILNGFFLSCDHDVFYTIELILLKCIYQRADNDVPLPGIAYTLI